MFKLSRAILLVNIDMSIVNIIACLPSSPPSNNCLGYQTQTTSQSKLSSRPFQTSSPAIRYVRIIKQGFCSHRCWKVLAEGFLPRLAPAIVESEICRIIQIVGKNLTPLSQRQTSNGMTKPILYHKTHTAWQKSYCMSFAMPSYFPCIHGKTHVFSAPPYP